MSTISKKERNSGLEMLKIIAFCMIIIDHAVEIVGGGYTDYLIDVSQATGNIMGYVCLVMHYLGMMADVIFIAASAWFLVDDDRVSGKKIAHFIGDKYFITVMFIAIALLLGHCLPPMTIASALMPHSLWFVACYVMYYAFHPCVNAIIRTLNKKELLLLNTVMVGVYCIYVFLIGEFFGVSQYFCRLMGFFIIYLLIAYVKNYASSFCCSLKVNMVLLTAGILGQLLLLSITNFAGLHISQLVDGMLRWDTLINPFSIAIAIAAVNIANRGQFVNKTVNYISSLSLLVYMFHANDVFRTVIGPTIVAEWTRDKNLSLVVVLLVSVIVLIIGSILLSIIYKHTLQKAVYRLCDVISNFICRIYKHFENAMMRIK